MTLEVGQIVDHYRLDEIIAQGKVTVVFAAFDLRLQRPVAFKVLDVEMAADQSFRERFAREATTAARLGDHPRIVTVFDSNVVQGSLYFVTEFLGGMSLHDLIRSRPAGHPLPPATVVRFVDQIAGALDYAHRHNAVHRDVKPANIMIKTTEVPTGAYLIDFGITKRLDAPGETSYGMFVGTADYASPEQIRRSVDVDRRADVYSLACTAFEALTGRQPYATAADDVARVAAHLLEPIPSAVALQPSLPAAVDDVFVVALAKDKHDRYESCTEFAQALADAFPDDALVRAVGAPSGAPLPALTSAAAAAPHRRRRTPVAAAAAAVILLSSLGGWLTWGRSDDAQGVAVAATIPTTSTLVATTSVPAIVAPTTVPGTTATPTTVTATTVTATAGAQVPAARSTAAPITIGPPSKVLGPYGNVVGQPVTQPTNSQSAVALALQSRQLPSSIADAGTPTFFYAEWLRLVAGVPATPVLGSANGFVIDANGPADLNAFHVGTDGKVDTMTECALVTPCQPLDQAIQISPDCQPGPDCAVFASDDEQMVASLRATVNLRSPITTLIFNVSALNPVTTITDATGTVHFDAQTGYFSLTLPAGPPAGTESVVTVAFLDGSTSKLTVTYGD